MHCCCPMGERPWLTACKGPMHLPHRPNCRGHRRKTALRRCLQPEAPGDGTQHAPASCHQLSQICRVGPSFLHYRAEHTRATASALDVTASRTHFDLLLHSTIAWHFISTFSLGFGSAATCTHVLAGAFVRSGQILFHSAFILA